MGLVYQVSSFFVVGVDFIQVVEILVRDPRLGFVPGGEQFGCVTVEVFGKAVSRVQQKAIVIDDIEVSLSALIRDVERQQGHNVFLSMLKPQVDIVHFLESRSALVHSQSFEIPIVASNGLGKGFLQDEDILGRLLFRSALPQIFDRVSDRLLVVS